MSMCDCCGCGPGPTSGAGIGFEPVPEYTEGAIHSWGIEGAQPEDRVSSIFVKSQMLFAHKIKPVVQYRFGGGGDDSDFYGALLSK